MPFVKMHQECNDCGSSDALCTNDDGWTHCFACEVRKPPESDDWERDNSEVLMNATAHDSKPLIDFVIATYKTLIERGISSETAKSYKCLSRDGSYFFGKKQTCMANLCSQRKASSSRLSKVSSMRWRPTRCLGLSIQ